jgi:hypothetical protein
MTTHATTDRALLARLWGLLGGPAEALDAVSLDGPMRALPSVYEVGAFASASVAAATLAVAEVQSSRTQAKLRAMRVDRRHAAAAFRGERYLEPLGWRLPPIWDPIAGDYATRDGFVRLHTNYAHHRDAVLRVLGVPATREAVAEAVRAWTGDALEAAVIEAGGCAAAMRSPAEWAAHSQGRVVADEPLFALETRPSTAPTLDEVDPADAPLGGVRVLDLTRVIAGPVCTCVLAAYGADVLRIDPPGFEEVGALLAETTIGKRRAMLDLGADADRARFDELVASAHLLVHGYRSDALARLGYGPERLRALNPALLVVAHDAYGWSGPWAKRRGFDSLVQMSCGIAFRGREAMKAEWPTPLPAQALDHGTGYLLAAAACRALTRALVERRASDTRLSLARTARLLMELGEGGDPRGADLTAADVAGYAEEVDTAFGPVRRIRCPGAIEGVTARWRRPAGPLGSDPARW